MDEEEVENFRKKVLAEKEIEERKLQLESLVEHTDSVSIEIDDIDKRIEEAEYTNKEHGGLIPDLADEVKRLKKRKAELEIE